jgi:hypothetical protein
MEATVGQVRQIPLAELAAARVPFGKAADPSGR